MEHPKVVGDRSTLAIMVALHELGLPLLTPFSENTRYDLVIEIGGKLARVQCKTGRLRKGAVFFATCSAYGHHRNPNAARRDYKGEVDYFAVYCPETTGVYLIPIEDLPARTQAALRVEPTRNNQKQGVRLAEQYQIAKVTTGLSGKPTALLQNLP
ncbi:MAG: group I intron-associated PD-(D/E)XK endonuclease [Actinomycetota bacterium]|nr:group I intron-associated PD-(D/E)XK endonuclease [Actinomycetota bacterium]